MEEKDLEQAQPQAEEKPKPTWQKTKEGWYDKVPLTVKQLDIIIWVCFGLLALVGVFIALDAMDIFHLL